MLANPELQAILERHGLTMEQFLLPTIDPNIFTKDERDLLVKWMVNAWLIWGGYERTARIITLRPMSREKWEREAKRQFEEQSREKEN